MAASRHLGFVESILGRPTQSIWGLYHFQNLVITAVALIIWKFKYFACLAIPAVKIGVLGAFDSLSKVQYHRDFEMHILAHKHVI